MAKKSPGNVAVLELSNRDLAGEGSLRFIVDVLGSYLKPRLEVLPREEEVKGRRGNDDL